MLREVRLYALSTCPSCDQLKRLLQQAEIPHDAIDVDLLPEEARRKMTEEMRTVSGVVVFPTLVVGQQVVVGYREQKIRRMLGLSRSWMQRIAALWRGRSQKS